ncbi:MAG: acetate--CoA ligase family protein [Calditrichaceae bacterium]
MIRLEKYLRPRSVAVIGASRKEGSLGKMFLDAVLRMNYEGKIYLVNPKADQISGIKCFPNIDSLPEIPDVAVILLPYQLVPESMTELGEAGIQNIIVISAGFKEVGGDGIDREKHLLEIAGKYGLNILGPNCMGLFNTDPAISFNGTFSPTLPNPGHVAFVSQSGALGVGILELAAGTDLGFSVFVSTGNKADITDADVLDFLYRDNNTKVITFYLESIDNPNAFRKICSRISAVKPLLAVKAGRTASGLKAASSHTGALANPDHIVDGFLKQCGVIRCDTLEDVFDSARALSLQPLPAGPRTAVITNAGGPGILASDALEKANLKLAVLSETTVNKLKSFLPQEAATGNPVDMIASANHQTYHDVLEVILNDEGVDSVILIMVKPPVNTTPAMIVDHIKSLVHNSGKTIIPVLMATKDETAGLDVFKELQLPVFSYPEAAVKSLGVMRQYATIQQRFRKSEAVVAHPEMEETLLASAGEQATTAELFELLTHYDIAVAPYLVTENIDDLIKFSEQQSGKIVLKIANEQIIHKSDAGLVALNIDTESLLRQSYQQLSERASLLLPSGTQPLFLAQKQLSGGIELVIGGKKDATFGPVLMVGFGGIFIEVLKDVSFRIAPVNAFEAREMISELRSQALLNGFRGNPAIDLNSFAYAIQRFGLLLSEHPEITEMDLNPLIWDSESRQPVVVDVRATLA